MDDREILYVDTVAEWAEWLEANAADSDGVRVAIVKRSAGGIAPYGDYLDVALCYGWIDGRRNSLDDHRFLQLFTPRAPKSIWSERNREHVARLTTSGSMKAAGLAEVERAKADGRWDSAYAPQSTADVPDDLAAAFAASPEAATFFAQLSSQNRYAILFRIMNAKRPETRSRQIKKFVGMLERHDTIYAQTSRTPKKA